MDSKIKELRLKPLAVDLVTTALEDVHGGERVMDERVGAVPAVVAAHFQSYAALIKIVKAHWTKDAMTGMWASPSQTPEERAKFRALFTIKRAIIETVNVNPESIIVQKAKRKGVAPSKWQTHRDLLCFTIE